MNPKTNLIYSMIYGRRFDPGFCEGYLGKLKMLFSNFEKLYEEYIEEILTVIAEVNVDWVLNYIPIYLTINIVPFSNPLTLRHNENPKYVLVVLIHELIHNNLREKFDSRDEMHVRVNEIMERVLKRLSVDLKGECEELRRRVG